MSLRGSLETFALTEVLTMVASTGKSGELQVDGEALTGRVWLEGGEVVGARAGEATDPADAVFRLLCLTGGEFRFETGTPAPEAGTPQSVDAVLAAAQDRLSEWREIEAVIPSPESVIRLQRALDGGDVQLTGAQWDAVVALGAGRSLAELMELLDQDELATGRVLKGLVEAGLATVQAAPSKRAARKPAKGQATTREADTTATTPGADTTDTAAEAPEAPSTEAAPAGEPGTDLGRTDLVKQLASLNEATYELADDAEAVPAGDEAGREPSAEGNPGAASETPDETVNRGMLLKFLSSVRS